jgi:hypothetical protein
MKKNVNDLVLSDELGGAIIKALGLPEHIKRFELIFKAQKPIIIKVEHMIWNPGKREFELPHLFSKYGLRKISS